jgi:DNA replication initiation complex subunit (GINS family)
MPRHRVVSRAISVTEKSKIEELITEAHQLSMELAELLMQHSKTIRDLAGGLDEDGRAAADSMLNLIDEETDDGEEYGSEEGCEAEGGSHQGSDEEQGDDSEAVRGVAETPVGRPNDIPGAELPANETETS